MSNFISNGIEKVVDGAAYVVERGIEFADNAKDFVGSIIAEPVVALTLATSLCSLGIVSAAGYETYKVIDAEKQIDKICVESGHKYHQCVSTAKTALRNPDFNVARGVGAATEFVANEK